MSDNQGKPSSSDATPAKLQICFFCDRQQLLDLVREQLKNSVCESNGFDKIKDFSDFVIDNCEEIDCLVLAHGDRTDTVSSKLQAAGVFLPAVVLSPAESVSLETHVANLEVSNIYHKAEIRLYPTQLKEITDYISLAINRFISFVAEQGVKNLSESRSIQEKTISQQRRLTDKLKERLGYLGFFCKRDPDYFWSNLPQPEQKELTTKITQKYHQILLLYFDNNCDINKMIDDFVNGAFFANISTSQILEIHMGLIDDFSHQLQIEGRNNDILLDYRLPLIDIIAHLCEMYRRSIPGSDGLTMPFALE